MKPIRVEPEAKDELAAAAAWYESRRPGFGHEFIIEVDAVFAAIARNPARAPTESAAAARRIAFLAVVDRGTGRTSC